MCVRRDCRFVGMIRLTTSLSLCEFQPPISIACVCEKVISKITAETFSFLVFIFFLSFLFLLRIVTRGECVKILPVDNTTSLTSCTPPPPVLSSTSTARDWNFAYNFLQNRISCFPFIDCLLPEAK